MHDFRRLEVWKRSRALVKVIFEASNLLPDVEVYGLTSQVKRSAISIPSNIAEGCGRGTNKQLQYHLDVALGSAFELETQICVAGDLNYLTNEKTKMIISEIHEIQRMVIGLKKSKS